MISVISSSNGVFDGRTEDVFQNYNKKRIVIHEKRVRTVEIETTIICLDCRKS